MTKMNIEHRPDSIVSFASKGVIRDKDGNEYRNDHSTLTDVGGTPVWLHNEKHTVKDGRVYMDHATAVDYALTDANTAPKVAVTDEEIASSPDTAQQTNLEQGKSGHKASDYKSHEDAKPVSPFSSTRPDDGSRQDKK